jgi:3-mercaptopyruvate sulfurtransferase SseA
MESSVASDSPIITCEELQAMLTSGQPVYIIDFTRNMKEPEVPYTNFLESHIPGARYMLFRDAIDSTAPTPNTLPQT